MNYIKQTILSTLFILSVSAIFAQGSFSGSLQLETKRYIRDSVRNAVGNELYDNKFISTDAWLNLNYINGDFDAGIRFDLFNNSILRNPPTVTNAQGIGYWYAHKKIDKLDLTGGYFYDQIGTGIALRAYEARPLAIDQALVGFRVKYDVTDNFQIKGIVGRQKDLFEIHPSNVKAFSGDWFFASDSSSLTLAPGFGVVNRTLDNDSWNLIAGDIATYSPVDSFIPTYNTYIFTAYNTLSYKNFSWYVEGVYKTPDAFKMPRQIETERADGSIGLVNEGRYVSRPGSVLYTNVNFSAKGLGVSLQAKRTEFFSLRTSPNLTLTRGMLNFIPPMARQNTYTLTARYNAATQELGEMAFQGDLTYAVNKKLSFLLNGSYINDLDGVGLYREVYAEALYKYKRKWRWTLGVQRQFYNQSIYEQKPSDKPNIQTITPFTEFLYRFTRKKSLRIEAQYLHSDEGFGRFAWFLAEYSIAPKWTFSVSDMIVLDPGKYYQEAGVQLDAPNALHFYSAMIFYSRKSNRFYFGYTQQLEGIVCTGGICRFEPAFNGFKLGMTSRF